MSSRTKLNTKSTTDDINYIIITRPQTDITFTITLDNPEAYGIDDIRITCDDPDSQIWLADGNGSGEWQKIQREADGTSVVGWDSANRYERTYNIRTTSEDAINSFKVVDVRLAGHDKFQSKETNSADLGNNELHIYKMDEDAYTLNVIENTFDYIKFNFNIKDEYKDIISNFEVKDVEYDEENGYWIMNESKNVEIIYDFELENGIRVRRSGYKKVKLLEIKTHYNGHSLHQDIETNNFILPIAIVSSKAPSASITYNSITTEITVYRKNDSENIYLLKFPVNTLPKCDVEIRGIWFKDEISNNEIDMIFEWSQLLGGIIIEINISEELSIKYICKYDNKIITNEYGLSYITFLVREMED
jgi:hypothetical protein